MTPQGLFNSRTELPALLPRVKAPGFGGLLRTPSASGSDACGVGAPCVPAGLGQEPWGMGWPPGNTQGRLAHSLLWKGEDADSKPEGGAVQGP